MAVNPFLKRIMNTKTEDVVHSSAYAQAQNQSGFGAASSESFEQRMKREKNRQLIKGYGESSVVGKTFNSGPRPKTFTPPPKSPGVSR